MTVFKRKPTSGEALVSFTIRSVLDRLTTCREKVISLTKSEYNVMVENANLSYTLNVVYDDPSYSMTDMLYSSIENFIVKVYEIMLEAIIGGVGNIKMKTRTRVTIQSALISIVHLIFESAKGWYLELIVSSVGGRSSMAEFEDPNFKKAVKKKKKAKNLPAIKEDRVLLLENAPAKKTKKKKATDETAIVLHNGGKQNAIVKSNKKTTKAVTSSSASGGVMSTITEKGEKRSGTDKLFKRDTGTSDGIIANNRRSTLMEMVTRRRKATIQKMKNFPISRESFINVMDKLFYPDIIKALSQAAGNRTTVEWIKTVEKI